MNRMKVASEINLVAADLRIHWFLTPVVSLLGIFAVVSGCGRGTAGNAKTTNQGKQRTPTIVVRTTDHDSLVIATSQAEFELLPSGYLRASLQAVGRHLTLDDPEAGSFADSEYPVVQGRAVRDFQLKKGSAKISDYTAGTGAPGKRVEITAHSISFPALEKSLTISANEDFSALAVVRTTYRNLGTAPVRLDRLIAQAHRFSAANDDRKVAPYEMWSFHGASQKWGLDEVTLLTKTFSRANPMQEVIPGSPGTGGGIPVVAFWNAQVGEAIGHLETTPETLSIPVKVDADQRVRASLELKTPVVLAPGGEYSTPLTFVAVYHGDFFEPLRMYSRALSAHGWQLPKPTAAAYKSNWCGWGYELGFTAAQMVGTIPKLKELGIQWATLDAGWFNNRGDWRPRSGLSGKAMKDLVDAFHQQGVRLTLWWIPIVAEDGHGKDVLNNRPYQLSDVVKQHPDWLILDKNGKAARMTADMAGLCPAVPEVGEYYRQLTERFIRDWDFDGHKLDFSYAVPPCYNPKHHHASPEDSTRAMGDVYKVIFDTTRKLKPESVTQSCPCGTPPNFAWLPYLDQAVTADPVGSIQVRRRIKMYKALLGPSAAVYGDHVELTRIRGANTVHEEDEGTDFASTVGLGGVPGTKFTWPDYGKKFRSVNLTPEKEAIWKKWLKIYDDKMLSQGTFLDLYVYGYDSPEGYAIAKDGKTYYAFFAPDSAPDWKGTLELRGLEPGRYRVVNYETGEAVGGLEANDPHLPAHFTQHLLLEVSPG